MNQILASALGLSLALVLWGIGRNPLKRLQANQDGFLGKSLNSANQISLVQRYERRSVKENRPNPSITWQLPKNSKERLVLIKRLQQLISGSPDERLEAIKLAGAWGHKRALPMLRRGLKDSDPRVVIEAARAIQKHRISGKKASLLNQELSRLRPPRNVALMR